MSDKQKQDTEEMMMDMPKAFEDVIQTKEATYEILEVLGTGSFGAVFRVRRLNDDKELAMKCESHSSTRKILQHEARVYKSLREINSPHFISLQDRGRVPYRFIFVVMKLVGKNLWDLRIKSPNRKFSMVTSIRVAEQTLAGIRDLHLVRDGKGVAAYLIQRSGIRFPMSFWDYSHSAVCGYIHRDIKPSNFATGREEDGDAHTIYIIDFGLSRQYRTADKDLRCERRKVAFRGTTRYASISALELREQSRKDDVEAWWYMVLEWMIGKLPWGDCKGKDREVVKQWKKELREEKNLKQTLKETPHEYMASIIMYIDTLEYASIPDYDHIAAQLEASMEAYNLSYSDPPDWDLMAAYLGPRYEKHAPHVLKCKSAMNFVFHRTNIVSMILSVTFRDAAFPEVGKNDFVKVSNIVQLNEYSLINKSVINFFKGSLLVKDDPNGNRRLRSTSGFHRA